ncbi:hypothetical protein MNB_SV-3-640 [hydrothermal vent metagenome]|uniref:Uncharacterized protein n=1 Tax=hydrothermal vent metagenome TaxID=652676 RepID=A0A1W1CKM1_9ZZZZ
MALNLKENHKNVKDKIEKERRVFLKKAVYATPTLIVMGQLTHPTRAKAWGEDPGGPPSKPE